LLTQQVKQSTHIKGGHNKETFMLNIKTFKKYCLKAGTKKADEIHEYYIKLEETL
jgi:phage anti-repressor protein